MIHEAVTLFVQKTAHPPQVPPAVHPHPGRRVPGHQLCPAPTGQAAGGKPTSVWWVTMTRPSTASGGHTSPTCRTSRSIYSVLLRAPAGRELPQHADHPRPGPPADAARPEPARETADHRRTRRGNRSRWLNARTNRLRSLYVVGEIQRLVGTEFYSRTEGRTRPLTYQRYCDHLPPEDGRGEVLHGPQKERDTRSSLSGKWTSFQHRGHP